MKALLTALVFMALSSGIPLQGGSNETSGYVVVLLGPPGSGKGTQAVDLSKQLNVPHISVGDLFRAHKKENTELGRKVVQFIDKGLLVPDEITIDMLAERVSRPDCVQGYILDGFPRTINQAERLGDILDGKRLVVVNLHVDDDDLVKRLSGRLMCRQCGNIAHKYFSPPKKEGLCDVCGGELYQRDDDKEAVVTQRLDVYHTQTKPLIEFYQKRGVLLDINGAQAKEQVLQDITVILEKNHIKLVVRGDAARSA